MSSADLQGNFLWHELMTTDPSAAGAFYSKVLGWKAQAWDKDPAYTVLSNAHGHVGGMMRLPGEAQANAASPSWLSYVAVPDVDAAATAAQRLGGRVVKPVSSLPDGGKYAILADPQSAAFGVCTAPSSSGGHAPDEFVWHELRTTDQSGAFRFYRELLGWEQLGVHDMGAMGPYLLFGRNGRQLGGMFNRPSGGGSPAHWLVYVRVASAAKAAEAASAAGGRVVQAPHQVPGGSWAAQLADPQGAAIAINQPPAAAAAGASTAAASTASAPKPAAAPAPRPAVPTAPKPARPLQPAAATPPAARPQAVASAPRPAAVRPAEVARAPSTAPAAAKPATAAPPSSTASAGAPKPTSSPAATAPKAAARKATKTAARKKARKAASRRTSPAKKRKKVAARRKTASRRGAAKRGVAKRGAARRGAARRGAAKRRPAGRRGSGRTRRKAAKRPVRRATGKKSAPRRKR